MQGSIAAGQVTFTLTYVAPLVGVAVVFFTKVTISRQSEVGLIEVLASPELSKYRTWLVVDVWPPEHGTTSGGTNCGGLVGSVGIVIPSIGEAVFPARKSATAKAAMFVAVV